MNNKTIYPQGHISITAQQLMANSGKLRGTDLSQWYTQAYASIPAYTGVCQGDASDSATSWFICQAYAKVAVMSQASAVWRSGIEQDMYKIVVLI